jgi:hypothetical protein
VFPYWILFSLFAAGAVQYRPDPQRPVQGGPILLAMAVVTALMVGLRFEVGGDWTSYLGIFAGISEIDFWSAAKMSDPGYTLLNWLAAWLGAGVWFVNLICGAIFIWGVIRFSREQPNPWLACAVAVPYLIIVVGMGYTRQAVALAIVLLGLVDMRTRQSIIRFGVYITVAAAFHKTVVVILPVVGFATARNRIATAIFTAILGATLYYAFVSARIDTMMENYVQQDYNSSGAGVRVVMNLIPAALILLFPSRFRLDAFERKIWRNFAIASWGALVLLLTITGSAAVDRLALYLIPLQLLVFSRVPYAFSRGRGDTLMLTMLVIGYSAAVQFVWLTSAVNSHAWIPYKVYL